MYADFSRDQMNAFLSDLTEQPSAGEVESIAETFSDDMVLAHMELARLKDARRTGHHFIPRDVLLPRRARMHPSDYH